MAHVANVTIDSSKVPSDLTDFPVLIDLSDMNANFWSLVTTSGGDIRCYKSDKSTELAREVVSCDTTGETGELHVKYSGTLSSSTDTVIEIHVDGVSSDYATTATYGAEAVWSDYLAVWHMTGTNAASVKKADSTGNGYTLTENNVTESATSGPFGDSENAYSLDGLDGQTSSDAYDWLSATQSQGSLGADFTYSIWLNFDSTGHTVTQHFMYTSNNGGGEQPRSGFDLNTSEVLSFVFCYNTSGTNEKSAAFGSALSPDTWYYVVGKRLTTTGLAYINVNDGTPVSSASGNTTAMSASTNSFYMNRRYNTTYASAKRYLDGQFSEARIRTGNTSADWDTTEYNNQNSASTFYAITDTSGIIAHDSTAEGFRDNSAGTSTTWSHVCSGDDRILFVHIATYHPSSSDVVTSVTYNGVAMTQHSKNGTATTVSSYLYYLVNPASGSNTVTVNHSSVNYTWCLSSSYTGVDQTSPIDSQNDTYDATTKTSWSATTNVVKNGCWLVGATTCPNVGITATSPTISRAIISSTLEYTHFFDSSRVVDVGSQSLDFTASSGTARWHIASLAPASPGIQFDSSGDNYSNAHDRTTTFQITNHTITGTDTYLMLAIATSVAGTINTVNWNTSETMTLLDSYTTNLRAPFNEFYVYYLANPTAGAYNIDVTFTGSGNQYVYAVSASYTGVDGTTPHPHTGKNQTASATTLPLSIDTSATTSTENCWIVGGGFTDGNYTQSVGTGTAKRTGGLVTNWIGIFDQYTPISPPGTDTINVDQSSAAEISIIGGSLSPVQASAGGFAYSQAVIIT